MGFYSQVIFPRLLDWAMSNPTFAKYREEVLAGVEGEVLEIGFGTGLNLSYYPESLEKLVTVDVNAGSNKIAQKRLQSSNIVVDNRVLNGENLPMENATFDAVVSTWTLCSIAKIEQALSEIYRVLKPGGKFFFIEHGLSNEPKVQVWQNRLNPVQNIIADGCNLNRNMRELIEKQFDSLTVEEFYIEDFPKVGAYMYQGVAMKENNNLGS